MLMRCAKSWENLYTTELRNHDLDPSDEGTVWFDDSSAEDKVLSFLSAQIEDAQILGDEVGKHNCTFLDLGTGNGHLLFALRHEDEGWKGRMLGVDYSLKSIEFAQRIAKDKGFGPESGEREVEFAHWDIMTQPASAILNNTLVAGFDVVLDKGTFDAISLSSELDASGRRIVEGYRERIIPLIRQGGVFLVTSCNWTEEELKGWFEGPELRYVGTIGYRSFSFGGKKGQTISSVCFRRESG